MVKFVKNWNSAMNDFIKERRKQSRLKSMGMGVQSLKGIYKVYFYSMEGFILGNPSKWQEWGLDNLVHSGVTGVEDKKRIKEIVSNWKQNKLVTDKDKFFLEHELKPWFEASLKAQTKKVFSELMKDFDSTKMDSKISDLYKANKGVYR